MKAALADGTLAPERWESYLSLQAELEHLERRLDKRAASEAHDGGGARSRARHETRGRREGSRSSRSTPTSSTSGDYDRVMPTVGEIMAQDVLCVGPDATLVDAAERMHERRVGAVVVLETDRLVGILTERDVLRAVATGKVECTVSAAMTHGPDTVEAAESAGHAAALMIHGGFRHLPVVDGARVVGIVSIRDLVRLSIDDEAPRGV